MNKWMMVALATLTPIWAGAATFSSPNGLTEECRILAPIPEGKYSKDDLQEEIGLCQIDFYNTTGVALCPKTWSTSPGTMVYDITASGLSQKDYEAKPECGGNKEGHEKFAKYKQTMNQSGTSGTFSPASLLYYQFSRYFDASTRVPVAVYRTMDKDAHLARVTTRAAKKKMGKGKMNQAGWDWNYAAETTPSKYKPTAELFTDDNRQIFGSMIGDSGGERYGAEFNGIRSGGSTSQNLDFQKTPAFLALKSEKPLLEAIAVGLEQGMKDKTVRAAMGGGASNFQMAIWMKELTEIVILDYIFSQQDRVGNLDYKWYIYWIDAAGKVQSDRVKSDLSRASQAKITYPKVMDGAPTQLVQRTQMSDNDAGGRVRYANRTKETKMLEGIRHIDRATYDKLVSLNADLQAGGVIAQHIRAQIQLDDAQFRQIVNNTRLALEILEATNKAGKLQFDLGGAKTMFKSLN